MEDGLFYEPVPCPRPPPDRSKAGRLVWNFFEMPGVAVSLHMASMKSDDGKWDDSNADGYWEIAVRAFEDGRR